MRVEGVAVVRSTRGHATHHATPSVAGVLRGSDPNARSRRTDLPPRHPETCPYATAATAGSSARLTGASLTCSSAGDRLIFPGTCADLRDDENPAQEAPVEGAADRSFSTQVVDRAHRHG